MTKSYDIEDSERVPVTVDWPGHEQIHFVERLTGEEK